jgi:hypothetical protein
MKPRLSFRFIAALLALALAVLACGGGTTAKSTRTPAPTEEEEEPTEVVSADEIEIISQSTYTDSGNYFHVVGEIRNDSKKALTDIELTIEIKDADGNSLLKEDDEVVDSLTFYPLLSTLAPDETTPFDYYLSLEEGGDTPAEDDCCEVTVTGQQTGEVDRADLEVENGQQTTDKYGDIHLTGEIVNKSNRPVQINGLAGAVLNKDEEVIAADWSSTVTRYLGPNEDDVDDDDKTGYDRTPFDVTLSGPVDNVDDWRIFWDADQVEEAASTQLEIAIARGYLDIAGYYHVVGTLTNNGEEMLNVSLVAGLYADDDTVLDADTITVPINLGAGESTPYDFSGFDSVNYNADEAARIDSFTIQVDHYWTYATTSDFVPLETSDEDNAFEAGTWTVTGNVVNSSAHDLSNLVVVVDLHDADDNILAVGSTTVYPQGDDEAIAEDETVPFEMTIYLDPDLDTSDLQFTTYVQGYVK